MVNKKSYVLFDENAYATFVERSRGPSRAATSSTPSCKRPSTSGLVYRADTWQEIAQPAGLDPDALVATIEEYNALVEKGADTDFGKQPEYLAPLATPPFFMIPLGTLLSVPLPA